jgi:hypothetical protein
VGRFAGFNLCIQVVSGLLDARPQIPADGGEDRVEKLARSSDGLLDIVRVVDLLFLQTGTVLLDGLLYLQLLHRLSVRHKTGSIRKDLLEVGEGRRVGKQRDGTEAILEVREDERNGAFVVDTDKIDALVNAVVETADVEKVSWPGVARVKSGYLACAYLVRSVPDVNKVFSLLISRCIKTFSTSSRITAFTSAGSCLSSIQL